VAAFWACVLRGAVVVPMDDGAGRDFVGRVVRDAGVKLVIASREKIAAGSEIFGQGLQAMQIEEFGKILSCSKGDGGCGAEDLAQLADEPVGRKHVAEILFTSGTTSEPRGVVLTHGNFLANLEPLEAGLADYRKYERWFHPVRLVTMVPLSHVFGQFMGIFVPPLLGMTVVMEASANPAEIIRSIKNERATALVAVPRMLDGLRAGIERDLAARHVGAAFKKKLDEASGKKFLRRAWIFRGTHWKFGWKFWAFISGGAALASGTEEFFKRIGYAVVQGYGMTETASLISLNHPFRAVEGTIGKILPGREFRLAEDGEILVHGENVSAGYWEAGALKASEEGGWLHTGDIGELDGEGNLRFRGRKKNVLVTAAGLNIYPEDLEAALRKQPEVRDCVVIPIEKDGSAEACAVLVLNAGKPTSAEGVENVARHAVENANLMLAEFQRMRTWAVWPEVDFPRTPTGKPRLGVIRDYAAQLLHGGSAETAGSDSSPSESLNFKSTDAVEKLLRRISGKSGQTASGTDDLESGLALSSLDRVELMSALEEKFQVELSETAFSNAKSVGDIQRLLKEPQARLTEYIYPRWAQRAPIRWLRIAVYYALVWPATLLLAHPKVIGRENLKNLMGPVLIVSNHVTRRADIGLILAALPARYRHSLATAMGGETLQNMRRPPREWLFIKRWIYQIGYWMVTALFNVFPLPQRSGFRESFRFAGESVDRGYSVLVFPEGELTADGKMAAFQSGIGLLVEKLRVPVIPMRLEGLWEMKREGRRLAGVGEITVRIGAPVTFAAEETPETIARALEETVRAIGFK
jgi:long-chain acyl-CoA synthetase